MTHDSSSEARLGNSALGEWSVSTQRQLAAVGAVGTTVTVFLLFLSTLGLSVSAGLAAVGVGGLVYVGAIAFACRRYGHAVECPTGAFCACERCGRPMDDR